jgi:hypothetical protein
MSEPGMARQRLGPQSQLEIPELAFGAAAIEMIALDGCDPGGIVAAIFKSLERVHQLFCDRAAPENADNAAHTDQYPQIVERWSKSNRPVLTRTPDDQILNNYCGLRQG